MKKIILLSFVLLFSTIIYSQEFELELVKNGFSSPVDIKNAGDDRLFIVERGGQIKILKTDGSVNTTPFLNISSIITAGNERGLLGLAFHPNYNSNGYFYVNYTNTNGDTVVARYTVSSGNADIAEASSALIMLTVDQPFSNHNGGHLAFGPDGKLFIGMGDGGSGGDPMNNSQNMESLLGKMLRLDVDITAPYIPTDNPYSSDPNAASEIWASGLRNPWKFSFDSETGNLWIADVGQESWEEINKQASTTPALNYGWRCYEGNVVYNNTGCPPQGDLTSPLAVYPRTNGNCSVTGGYVYRGSEYPSLQGLYFFSDYCRSEIGTITQDGTLTFHGPSGASSITSFGVSNTNEIYVAAFNGGSIFKIVGETASITDHEIVNIQLYPNPASQEVTLTFSGKQDITQLDVFNIQGSLITSSKINPNQESKLDVRSFESGFYVVVVTDKSNKKFYKKLIVK